MTGDILFKIIIAIVIFVIILGVLVSLARSLNTGYRIGSGMFKSSKENLSEKDEVSDKEYFDEDGLFK